MATQLVMLSKGSLERLYFSGLFFSFGYGVSMTGRVAKAFNWTSAGGASASHVVGHTPQRVH